tara:strand:- start:1861 stop:2559 length:699 start_codon:yes stop_codon:yes gene_type:complete
MSAWKESKFKILSEVDLNNKDILDIGCGDGWFLFWSHNFIKSGLGIDPSKEQINLAETRNNNNKISFKNIGAENISNINKKFDLIFYFNSFHHIPEKLMFASLSQISKCMNIDGLLIIVEPIARGSFYDFMKEIDDEYYVRLKAYENILNCNKAKLMLKKEIFYEEIKSFNDYEQCIHFLKNVDKKRVSYIEENIAYIKNKFYDLANNNKNKFEFIQPMRMNILSLMKGEEK